MIRGIDVSKWQGDIDWQKVKDDGVQFAMIRLGCGSKDGRSCAVDRCFSRNVSRAVEAGIDAGCYFYSYAQSVSAAEREADFVVSVLKQYPGVFTYPVAFDLEDVTQQKLGKAVLTEMVIAFGSRIERAGYFCSLYSNPNWLRYYLDASQLTRFDLWLAQWTEKPTWSGAFSMWQNSASGTVSGIAGPVDTDVAYRDYPGYIRAHGLNGFKLPAPKDIDAVAREVLRGKWGAGTERRRLLTEAGYDYAAVQARVNEMVNETNKRC